MRRDGADSRRPIRRRASGVGREHHAPDLRVLVGQPLETAPLTCRAEAQLGILYAIPSLFFVPFSVDAIPGAPHQGATATLASLHALVPFALAAGIGRSSRSPRRPALGGSCRRLRGVRGA